MSDEHGRALSAGAFADEAERAAAWLYARGVREGSVVSWQLPTTINALLVSVALSRLGAVQNPLVTMLREPDVEFMVRQAGSAFLLVPESQPRYDHASMARRLEGRVPGLRALVLGSALPHGSSASLPHARGAAPDDVRWLYYTSGTTAVPKGARHRDSDLVAAARTFCAAVSPGPNDVISSIAPVAHVGGVVFFLGAVRSGAHLVVTESFAPLETARHLSAAGTTLCCSGLPFVQGFLEVQRQNSETRFFPDLRAFLIGGSPRNKALHEQVMETFGAKIVSGYGMTEVPLISVATLDDSLEHLAVADGRPSGVDLKITTPDGALVPPGESGEVRVRGHSLMAGYVDANLDSAAFDEDGYFRTGDLARIDDEGFLIVTGRLKDIIIRNMENISAANSSWPSPSTLRPGGRRHRPPGRQDRRTRLRGHRTDGRAALPPVAVRLPGRARREPAEVPGPVRDGRRTTGELPWEADEEGDQRRSAPPHRGNPASRNYLTPMPRCLATPAGRRRALPRSP